MTLEADPPELAAVRARFNDDQAEAEEHYAQALLSLGRERDAAFAAERARGHRAKAALLRRGAA